MVVKRSSKDATVVGVVSFGDGCGIAGKYGVYTNVYSFLPFINSVLNVSSCVGYLHRKK